MYTSVALMIMLLTLPIIYITHGGSIRTLQIAAKSYPIYVSIFLSVMLTANALSKRLVGRVIIHDPGSQPLSALLTKTEIDFVLTSPLNVNTFIAIKSIIDYIIPYTLITTFGSLISLLLILMNIHDPLIIFIRIIIYAVNVVLLSTLLGLFNLIIPSHSNHYIDLVLPTIASAYLLVSSLVEPGINPLLNMSNAILTPILLIAIIFALVPIRGLTRLIYTDAYGLFIQLEGRLSKVNNTLPLGSSIFRIILSTSVRWGFKVALSMSALASLILTVITLTIHMVQSLEFLIYLLGFFIAYVHTAILGGTLAQERPWINFMTMDGLTYIRLRMLSRLVVTYITLAPIIAYLLILFLVTESPLVLLEVFSIISMPPLTVPISWIIMAEADLPQSRGLIDDNLRKNNVKVLILLSLMYGLAGLFLLPLAIENIMITIGLIPINYISSFTISIGLIEFTASALCYMLVMYSGFSRRIWYWFINKLTENGYV